MQDYVRFDKAVQLLDWIQALLRPGFERLLQLPEWGFAIPTGITATGWRTVIKIGLPISLVHSRPLVNKACSGNVSTCLPYLLSIFVLLCLTLVTTEHFIERNRNQTHSPILRQHIGSPELFLHADFLFQLEWIFQWCEKLSHFQGMKPSYEGAAGEGKVWLIFPVVCHLY